MDDIDDKIIEALKKDGRVSLTDMASSIDLTRVAIANRLDKLISNQVVCIKPLINCEKTQLSTLIIEANVENKLKFAQVLDKSEYVINYYETTSDKYNYLVILMGESIDSLKSFIDDKIRKVAVDLKIILSSNPKGNKFILMKPKNVGEKK